MYNLQSRYYDPVTCRFLSGDAYVSTGQGVLGYNMFAYCNNNPVILADSKGDFPWVVIGVAAVALLILSGCTTTGVGSAPDYLETSDPNTNCLGYAIQDYRHIQLEGFKENKTSIDEAADLFNKQMKKSRYSIRSIETYDAPIYNTEYRIALRVGAEDYHFMRQDSDGRWSHKPGQDKSRRIDGDNPEAITWDRYRMNKRRFDWTGDIEIIDCEINYYNSTTKYFAVSLPRG